MDKNYKYYIKTSVNVSKFKLRFRIERGTNSWGKQATSGTTYSRVMKYKNLVIILLNYNIHP